MPEHDKRIWFMTGLFAGLAAHRSVPDLLGICRDWQPSIVIRNDCEFAAGIVAERLGLPCVTIGVDLGIPATHLASVVGRPLGHLRAAHGLAREPQHRESSSLYLSLVPPRCQLAEFLATATVRSVRPDETQPTGADRYGRPVVHVSVESGGEAIVGGLRRGSFEAVLELGDGWTTTDIVVTDGRFGDVAVAVARGLPMLISPEPSTRGFHFPRWEALGVARLCAREALTEHRLIAEVQALVDDPRYRWRAARLRDESLALDGPDGAVTLCEQLAAGIVPRPAPAVVEAS